MAAADKVPVIGMAADLRYAQQLQNHLCDIGAPTTQEYVRNMAELQYGRQYKEEQLMKTAESLGFEVRRRAPQYIKTLMEHGRLDLAAPENHQSISHNTDEKEMMEVEEFLSNDPEKEEKFVTKIILDKMKLYKEEKNLDMMYHLQYNKEIKIDVEEYLFKKLDLVSFFSCRCMTTEGQVHYHAMVQQTGVIRKPKTFSDHFKRQRAVGGWVANAYQVTKILSDHHFVNACKYMCLIKANRGHGPHSERLFKLTPVGGNRVWNSCAEVYENLYKEKCMANMSYHERMKKNGGKKGKKIIVNNV